MLKFLLLIGIIVAVYYMFFAKKRTISSPKNDNSMEDTMIPCTQCGTYVQAKEALMRNGKHYCSPECLKEAS